MELDFTPIKLILSDRPEALGIGGLDIVMENKNLGDIYKPAYLTEETEGRLSVSYNSENLLTRNEGEDKNTEIGSISKGISAIIPINSLAGSIKHINLLNTTFAFDLKERRSEANVRNSSSETSYGYNRRYNRVSLALGFDLSHILKIGYGLEQSKGKDEGFANVVLQPSEIISLGYRQYHRDFRLDTYLNKEEHHATLPFSLSREIKEFSIKTSLPDYFMVEMTTEDNNFNNYDAQLSVYIGRSLSFRYSISESEMELGSDIQIDGNSGSHNHIIFNDKNMGYGFILKSVNGLRYFLSYKISNIRLEGAGKLVGNFALSFWESLLAGQRFFNYGYDADISQYHLGMDMFSTKRSAISGGFQYVIIKPDGQLNHWTPFPIIGIGRLDEKIINVDFTQVNLGGITFGYNYKYNRFGLYYEIGQLIPLKVERRNEEGVPVSDRGSINGSGSKLRDIWRLIRENPGGNLQLLKFEWYF